MPQYVVTALAVLESEMGLDTGWLKAVTGGKVKLVAPNTAVFVLRRRGRDAECAADRALVDINRSISPRVHFSLAPAWTARRAGLPGLGRRTAGTWHLGDGDDGLGGVREPRRPMPPTGYGAIALDPPA